MTKISKKTALIEQATKLDDIFERIEKGKRAVVEKAWAELASRLIDNKLLADILLKGLTSNRLNLIKDTARGDMGTLIEPAIEVHSALIGAYRRREGTSLEKFAEENTFKAIADIKARRRAEAEKVAPVKTDKPKGSKIVLPFKPKTGL